MVRYILYKGMIMKVHTGEQYRHTNTHTHTGKVDTIALFCMGWIHIY